MAPVMAIHRIKKCPNCLKVPKIALDNGIPLPSQSCPYCGFKIM